MRNLISVILSLFLGAGLAYADDLHREGSTHVSGSTGNFPMCVVNELGTALGTEGQYIGQACTTTGKPLITLSAGTADIGSLIGNTVTVTVAQTVAATLHAANDAVGGKVTIAGAVRASALSGVIQSVVITDLAGQAGSYDVVFFSADPSTSTITDDSPFDIADADIAKVICMVPVTTTSTYADNGITVANNAGCAFEVASGTSIYAAIVARSTPTFAGVSDVQIRVSILQD